MSTWRPGGASHPETQGFSPRYPTCDLPRRQGHAGQGEAEECSGQEEEAKVPCGPRLRPAAFVTTGPAGTPA